MRHLVSMKITASLAAMVIIGLSAAVSQAKMVFDPLSGQHVMVNSSGQRMDSGNQDRQDGGGGVLVDDGAGGKINSTTGEHLSSDGIGGYTGSKGTKYHSDQIGGQWDSEGNHYPGN